MGWKNSVVRPDLPATCLPPTKCPTSRMAFLLLKGCFSYPPSIIVEIARLWVKLRHRCAKTPIYRVDERIRLGRSSLLPGRRPRRSVDGGRPPTGGGSHHRVAPHLGPRRVAEGQAVRAQP